MTHPPAAARILLATALSATVLLGAAACSVDGRTAPGSGRTAASTSSSAGPAAEQSAALTATQVRAALITEADLGQPWVPTRGGATWRDGLLKASTEDADCQRLLDALYTEELFGTPTGPGAASALDDSGTEAQLRYQVAAHRPADVDRTLAWLTSLPGRCGEFSAATTRGGVAHVQVSDLPLPEAGDARQALRVVLSGQTSDGAPAHLTMDLAAVRVGENAITLTHGGYGDLAAEVTQTVVQLGTQRLTEIRKQGRAEV
ncbi:hypothetical protein [Streptomyces bullii]|uniref:PknH-like extracellular domain-containing protein n=1 Tax=Streptomyces bullii TaxID=349910 RepID=A0ABW0UND2_9ACTN